MADGSYNDPFYVLPATASGALPTSLVETTATVTVAPGLGTVWPTGESNEVTGTVTVGGVSSDWQSQIMGYQWGSWVLLCAILLVLLAQLVVGLRR